MAKIPGSITVTGLVAPSDSRDGYAVTSQKFHRGGYHQVKDEAEMLLISSDRLVKGTMAYITDSGITHQWDGTDFGTNEIGHWKIAQSGTGSNGKDAFSIWKEHKLKADPNAKVDWADYMTAIKGNPGQKGQPGITGPAGTGVTIKGSDTRANIVAKSGASGDMWLITSAGADHGHGLVSNGTGSGTIHWTDVGAIQGPKGDAQQRTFQESLCLRTTISFLKATLYLVFLLTLVRMILHLSLLL